MAEQLTNAMVTPSATLVTATVTANVTTAFDVSWSEPSPPTTGTYSLIFRGASNTGSDDSIFRVATMSDSDSIATGSWEKVGAQATFTAGCEIDLDYSAASVTTGLATKADASHTHAATDIGTGSVDNTEFGYLDGVTSAIQTQINSRVSDAGDTMTGTLVGKNGTVTDTSMGPRSNQFGLYSTSVALIALARAGTEVFVASPVSVKFSNSFIQADAGFKSTYYTANDAYRIYTPNFAANGTANLAANYTPGDGIMYFDDVSTIISSGLKTPFSYTLDGTNWYVGTSVNSGTNSIACQMLTGTDTSYTGGVDYFQSPSAYSDNNCLMPTYGAPYMTVSTSLTANTDVWLPPRVNVGLWTKPAVAVEYGILADNVTAGRTVTVKDGYDGRVISQVTGGASGYGVGLRVKYDGTTGYFPIGKDAAP